MLNKCYLCLYLAILRIIVNRAALDVRLDRFKLCDYLLILWLF